MGSDHAPAKAPGNGVEALLNRRMIPLEQRPIGEIRLLRYATRPTNVELAELSYRFGDGIEPVGFRAERTRGAGNDILNITLKWRASQDQSNRPDYMVFVHVLNDNGEMIAQADGPPASGYVPTSSWRPNEAVHDLHSAVLPDKAPSSLRVLVGLYNLSDGNRLPLTAPGLGAARDHVALDLPSNL